MHDEHSIPYGFCHCRCGEKTNIATRTDRRAGWVKGEPLRYLLGHNARPSGPQWVEEDRGHDTPCWVWQWGIFQTTGYGMYRQGTAHRYVYEQARGIVPGGLELDHLCRVRECVNPDHLEAVTHAENVRRGASPKLSREAVTAIRASGESSYLLARRYGVLPSTITAVRDRRTWHDA